MQSLEQEEASVARLVVGRRTQALVDQASRAAEAERPRVFTLVQPHCPTCGAPLVTVTDRRSALDTCAPEQGVWLDGDACLCFGEALRPCPGQRSLVARHTAAELDLSGYRWGVLPSGSCVARGNHTHAPFLVVLHTSSWLDNTYQLWRYDGHARLTP